MRYSPIWQKYAFLNGIVYFLLGIVTLIAPRLVFNTVIYLIVLYLLIQGLWQLLQAFKNRHAPVELRSNLTSGLILIVIATFLLLFSHPLISFLPFAAGLITLLLGIQQLVVSWELREVTRSRSWLIFSALMIVVGLILLTNPFNSVMALLRVFGLVLIAFSIPQFFQQKG